MKCPSCNTDNLPELQVLQANARPRCRLRRLSPPLVTETLETAREELTTGTLFAGRYQIIEELGHGGMGRVYRALDKKLNEEVALKLVRAEIATTAPPSSASRPSSSWRARSAILTSAGCTSSWRRRARTSSRWSMSPDRTCGL